MRTHRNLWLSSCGNNFTSWQHTKYVGFKGNKPSEPIFNDPWSVYAYESDYRTRYGWGNMRAVELWNINRLQYYVLDESYRLLDDIFNPTANIVRLSRFPATFIYHLNGTINNKQYITVKNLTSLDYLEANAKVLPLVCNAAFAWLSDYMPFNISDFDTYIKFLKVENETINNVGYARLQQNLYRVNSYEYKTTPNSFFNPLFKTPSVMNEGTLKYKGYDYTEPKFKLNDIAETVTKPGDMTFSNNLPNRFSGYSTTVGVVNSSRILSIEIPSGSSSWSKIGDNDEMLPEYVTFGNSKGCTPTNTFKSLNNIEENPYLPDAGKENSYEVQTLVFQRSSAGASGRWFHLITRYWWNPSIGE